MTFRNLALICHESDLHPYQLVIISRQSNRASRCSVNVIIWLFYKYIDLRKVCLRRCYLEFCRGRHLLQGVRILRSAIGVDRVKTKIQCSPRAIPIPRAAVCCHFGRPPRLSARFILRPPCFTIKLPPQVRTPALSVQLQIGAGKESRTPIGRASTVRGWFGRQQRILSLE